MDEELKSTIVKEIIRLSNDESDKDKGKDEEIWGKVEEIWGSALKIGRIQDKVGMINIMAGQDLKLNFELAPGTNLTSSYLEVLKKTIADKTVYKIDKIDIVLKNK